MNIIVRTYNELQWLPLLFDSLEEQENIEISNVIIIDNNSSDHIEKFLYQYPNLNVHFIKYVEEYIPGKILNYGIKWLFENTKSTDEEILIISAHCFFDDKTSLSKLKNALDNNENCRVAFGRQIPMNISSNQAIRDLSLIYPKESKEIKIAPMLNNAFSLFSKSALKDHLFDEEVTNLEDVIWAHKEINQGYSILYCSESEVVHYHGPHHNNNERRLTTTAKTITNHSKAFNLKIALPKINPQKFIQVFVRNKFSKTLDQTIKRFSKDRKVIVWGNDVPKELLNKNVIQFNRESLDLNIALYNSYGSFFEMLKSKNLSFNYFIFYDETIDGTEKIVDIPLAVEKLRENFCSTIWPVKTDKRLIFSENDGKFKPAQALKNGIWKKQESLVALRGNGTVLSVNALLNQSEMFENYNFIYL